MWKVKNKATKIVYAITRKDVPKSSSVRTLIDWLLTEEGQKVVVVDDLLATGGTIHAAIDLVNQLGGEVVGVAFLIELTALHGRDSIPCEVKSLIQY